MRNTLLLRRDPANPASWRWLKLDQEGQPQGGIQTGTLTDAAGESAGQRVVVLVSGADTLLTRVSIPGSSSRQKLLRAVPYALEEQLSEDVEDLHFAVGTAMEEGAWPVAVISRHVIQDLTEDALEAGLDIQQVIPEVLALPYRGNETSVLVENDVALVRTGESEGFAVDSDNLGMLLAARMIDSEDTLPPLHLFVPEDNLQPDTAEYVGETLVEPFGGDSLYVFAQGLNGRAINLLQGDFSRSSDWVALLRPWRATAALLVAGIILSNVVMGIDYFRLKNESEQLSTRIEQTFKTAMPETRRIVNPRIQMQQQLDKLQRKSGSGGGFLSLLGQSGKVLKDMQGVQVDGATFRAGRLDVDLKVSNLQLLDQLKQELMKSGRLKVEIQSATTGKDQRVQSRLRIAGVGT